MALSASALKGLMKANIEALNNFPTNGQNPVVVDDRVLGALAAAIVTHITGSGVVNTGIPVQVDTGSGSGATIAPGTIS